jgi:hypothetical protein
MVCVHAFLRRECVRAHCLRAHGVDACIHPAPSPWCTGRCFSATTTWRACVHTTCVRAHGVRACTRRAFAHTARACTRHACVHTAIIGVSIQRRLHRVQVAATAPPSSQPAQMLPLPLCAAPLGFTQGPNYPDSRAGRPATVMLQPSHPAPCDRNRALPPPTQALPAAAATASVIWSP